MHDSCQSEVTKPAGLGKSVKKEEGAGVLHWGGAVALVGGGAGSAHLNRSPPGAYLSCLQEPRLGRNLAFS